MPSYLVVTVLVLLVRPAYLTITFPRNADIPNEVAPTDASLDLGLKILENVQGKNAVVSPSSLSTCLWLLYSGARGDTNNELRNVLGAVENSTLTSAFGPLSDTFTANAAFIDNSTTVKPEYASAGDKSVFSVYFPDQEEARQTINTWVSEQTKGVIPTLLVEPPAVATKAVIVSAMYFNATWLYPFSPTATKLGKFEITPEESVNVTLMSREAQLPFFRGPLYNAVGLPYASNGFTLYILLPHAKEARALKNMVRHLSSAEINKMVAGAMPDPVIVTLPKLYLDFKAKLRSILQSLGVNKMFDQAWADFGDLIEENPESKLFISDVVQSVHLEVDEGGTRGGAATAVLLTKSSRTTFRATRPFAYLLRHESGQVLFLGTVSDPRS